MLLVLLGYCSDCVEIPPVPRNSAVNTKAAVGLLHKSKYLFIHDNTIKVKGGRI